MGTIELDPCSNREPYNVPAEKHYTKEDDGLAKRWTAKSVYLNPPYGREIGEWIERLCEEYEMGAISEAIALVPSRTDTQWFRRFDGFLVCFIEGRLTFINNDNAAPFPSAVFYLGQNKTKFIQVFSKLGSIYQAV
jgi:hypothetical protein